MDLVFEVLNNVSVFLKGIDSFHYHNIRLEGCVRLTAAVKLEGAGVAP